MGTVLIHLLQPDISIKAPVSADLVPSMAVEQRWWDELAEVCIARVTSLCILCILRSLLSFVKLSKLGYLYGSVLLSDEETFTDIHWIRLNISNRTHN